MGTCIQFCLPSQVSKYSPRLPLWLELWPYLLFSSTGSSHDLAPHFIEVRITHKAELRTGQKKSEPEDEKQLFTYLNNSINCVKFNFSLNKLSKLAVFKFQVCSLDSSIFQDCRFSSSLVSCIFSIQSWNFSISGVLPKRITLPLERNFHVAIWKIVFFV